MNDQDKPAKIAATLNIVASLEDILSKRGSRTSPHVTGRFRESAALERAIDKLKRGADECQQLIELNPKCEERYLEQLGEIAASTFEACKRPEKAA